MEAVFAQQKAYAPEVARTTHKERKAKIRKLMDYLLAHQTEIEQALMQDFRKHPEETILSELLGALFEQRRPQPATAAVISVLYGVDGLDSVLTLNDAGVQAAATRADEPDLQLLGRIDSFSSGRSEERTRGGCGARGGADEVASIQLGGGLLFRAHFGFSLFCWEIR